MLFHKRLLRYDAVVRVACLHISVPRGAVQERRLHYETMKTIIFDFGNVVAFFDHHRTLQRVQPHSPLSVEMMYASVYASDLEARVERGDLSVPEFLQQVHKTWQLDCELDFLLAAIGDIFWPNPEICELIPRLAPHYRILLGSNTNAIHSRQFIAQFADVLCHFDSLVLSHEIGTRKPDVAFFRHCHSLAQADLAECVFVDDIAANIAGARSVGFHAIHYRPNEDVAGQLRGLGVEFG
ncbi:MAG: HAD family phosphatase [Planctomycetes bacterium]|nr:HAD family phosphatase [Planctomycetota bacterium]